MTLIQNYSRNPWEKILEEEVHGAEQFQKARKAIAQPIHLLKHDQQTSCDDEEDLQVKKQQKHLKTHFSTSIPKLAALDTVFPIAEVAPPQDEEASEELSLDSDSSLDRAFHQSAAVSRESHYLIANHNMQEIKLRQKRIHDLHAEKEKLLDELAERMKKSGNLGWVHALFGLGTAALAVIGIAITIATGGLGAALIPALSAAATALNGAIGAENQILDLQSKKQQGDIEVLREEHQLENKKIEEDSHNRQVIFDLLHKLVEIELQIAKNRNYTRMN
jgi:hypothetical protein